MATVDEDVKKLKYQLEKLMAGLEVGGNLGATVYTDGTRPTAGIAGRIIYNTTDGKLNIDTGAGWTLPDGTAT